MLPLRRPLLMAFLFVYAVVYTGRGERKRRGGGDRKRVGKRRHEEEKVSKINK